MFSLFCPYSNQSPTKKCVFFYFCPILTKARSKKDGFLFLCSYTNQSPATKGVYSIFAIILTKFLPQRMVCLILHLFLPKPSRKGFFLYFVLILTKEIPKRVFFSLFFPLFSPKLYQKWCFRYFCSNQCFATNCVFLYFCHYSSLSLYGSFMQTKYLCVLIHI